MTAPGCPKHKSEPSGCAGRRPAASFTRHPDSDRLADSLWRGIGGTRSARGRTVTWNWDCDLELGLESIMGKTSRGRRRLPSLTSHRHAPGNTWAVGDGNSLPVNKGPEHGGGWGTRILHHLPHTNVVSPASLPRPPQPGIQGPIPSSQQVSDAAVLAPGPASCVSVPFKHPPAPGPFQRPMSRRRIASHQPPSRP